MPFSALAILRCHSPEADAKRRKKMSGANNINFGKRGPECSWFGKPLTAEHRAKISKALKGKEKGEEHKAKCRIANLGKHHPINEDTKLKIAERLRGHPVSEETKAKLAQYNGERASGWRGGIWTKKYCLEFSRQLKELIKTRDGYKCQICGVSESECLVALHVHHIDYNKDNCLPGNLIALCNSCHIKTNTKREHWLEYFKEIANAC